MTKTALDVYAEAIAERISNTRRDRVKHVANRDVDELARFAVRGLQYAIVDYAPLVEVCTTIGVNVLSGNQELTTSMDEKNRALAAFKVGYFLLDVLATDAKVISFTRGSKRRDQYFVKVDDLDYIDELLEATEEADKPVFVEPQYVQPEPFTKFWHPVAGAMVRNTHPKAYREFNIRKTPKVFETINKLMSNKYGINQDLLEVLNQCKEDDVFTFEGKILSENQLISKTREQEVILKMAEKVGDRAFYQYMFYDWRGRVYSATSYLNHTGHKLAKSLIQYHDKKPIRAEGYFFLLVHAANCWGFDKANIDGRYDFADSNLDMWLESAADPVNNKVWQAADSPFEFLAAIMEIKKSHAHKGGPYDYESGLLVAWDATCSGLQVLGALARDRHSAELANISKNEERGDYYKMIADHVWKETSYTEQELKAFNKLQEGLKEAKEESWTAYVDFTKANTEAMSSLAKVFWGRPEVKDKRRSIAKRPCMTYFYSCGPNKMSEALYDDFAPDFVGMDPRYTFWLASKIHKACRELMPVPTKLMKLFVKLGVSDYSAKKDFSLIAPYTEFPLMQYYREDVTEQVAVGYRGKRLQVVVCVGKNKVFNLEKIKSGTSPNVVHMLDAVLMAAITLKADYQVSCVHDSFACSVGDANKLYEDTRSAFVELFSSEILEDLIAQKGVDEDFEYGDLDITETIENEHCFS